MHFLIYKKSKSPVFPDIQGTSANEDGNGNAAGDRNISL